MKLLQNGPTIKSLSEGHSRRAGAIAASLKLVLSGIRRTLFKASQWPRLFPLSAHEESLRDRYSRAPALPGFGNPAIRDIASSCRTGGNLWHEVLPHVWRNSASTATIAQQCQLTSLFMLRTDRSNNHSRCRMPCMEHYHKRRSRVLTKDLPDLV